ncbi:MAG: hypothetical protein JNM60_11280 [Candidatus Competibacteraceae bacterium]|nr:hypothetical protein [Candidatus Competibacteraceae bacterium]
MKATHRVLIEIEDQLWQEREEYQRDWEGPWNPLESITRRMIEDYGACARYMVESGNLEGARHWYLKLAALAVAAVEAIDRRERAG